tara:strand:- start:8098 stop:8595 length:498 start_codon:yes stop_codon:yes gene_type:complete
MNWLKYLSIFVCILIYTFCNAQNLVKIKLDIKLRPVEHYKHHLKKCDVITSRNNLVIDSVRLRGYKLKSKLIKSGFYKIQFKKEGYIAKYIVINANNLPIKRKHHYSLKAELTLFRHSKNEDVSFLENEPISIAYYNETKDDMVWDFEYNRSIIEKIIHAQTKGK